MADLNAEMAAAPMLLFTVGKRKSIFALGHLPKQNEFVRLDQRGELAWVARVILGAEELEELGQEEDHLECAKEFQ